jgi:hypothetical protein
MELMKLMQRIFAVIALELVLVGILGFMTVDNNYCDESNPWHWSYSASVNSNGQPVCGMINVSIQSSEARFYALMLALASVPFTVLYGFFTATRLEKKTQLTKSVDDNKDA